MSKYVPIQHFLEKTGREHIPMSFEQIEEILGFSLPPSALKHRAWWSNNTSNSVMTESWMKAGYKTTDVDMESRRLVFRRDPTPAASTPADMERGGSDGGARDESAPHQRARPANSLVGRLKGYLSIRAGTDLAQPAEADWPQPGAGDSPR